jgi:hypothetical protein
LLAIGIAERTLLGVLRRGQILTSVACTRTLRAMLGAYGSSIVRGDPPRACRRLASALKPVGLTAVSRVGTPYGLAQVLLPDGERRRKRVMPDAGDLSLTHEPDHRRRRRLGNPEKALADLSQDRSLYLLGLI